MSFLTVNKYTPEEVITIYEKYRDKQCHTDCVNEMLDTIINAANYIISKSDHKYTDFHDLVSLFIRGSNEALFIDSWVMDKFANATDREIIDEIYKNIFHYIGFRSIEDVKEELDDDIIWEIYHRFPDIRKENFIDNRLDYVMKSLEKFDVESSQCTVVFFDVCKYKKKESSFNIQHIFTKFDEKIGCASRITFYSPENIGVTRSIVVFCNFNCNITNLFGYSTKENIEIDKWILRKASFLRFLEIANHYKTDRSWHPDEYMDTYWFHIYKDRERNKIRLG